MKQNLLRISISLAMITIASLTWAHDIIVTTDSKKIDAKILEVSKFEIKYKDIDNLDGPTFILPVGDIHCVIYSNGKVDIFKQSNENKQPNENTKTQEPQNSVTPAEADFYESRPKGVSGITGNSSLLFNKKETVYLRIDYGGAEIVSFGHNECGMDKDFPNIAEYTQKTGVVINLDGIEDKVCEKFNKLLMSQKCTLRRFTNNENAHVLIFQIEKIDVGNEGVSKFALNSGSTFGGAVVCGKIIIYDTQQRINICEIDVDRVKGIGALDANDRLENAIMEVICNKLFSIK